jgi:hypothetical protein
MKATFIWQCQHDGYRCHVCFQCIFSIWFCGIGLDLVSHDIVHITCIANLITISLMNDPHGQPTCGQYQMHKYKDCLCTLDHLTCPKQDSRS